MMFIKQIKIQDFKNFSSLVTFNFDKTTNIITGKNGIGKTSILDAIVWAIRGRLLSGSQDGWKPKELYIDPDGNILSRFKDVFNTMVEVTIGFDDGQKDLILKRTSCCGKSTVPYYNGITDTQKQINKYLEKALGFDLEKLLIFTNPEILFNTNNLDQKETHDLIYDSVCHKVQNELQELYDHLFDDYDNSIKFLEDGSLEKTIAEKVKNSVKRQLAKEISENDIIVDLQEQIDKNILILNTKSETIKSQELVLADFYQKQKQEKTYQELEQNLDKQEQILRAKLFEKNKLAEELSKTQKNKDDLVIWLDDFNNLLKTNPSNNQIKMAFGLPVVSLDEKEIKAKINVLSKEQQKIKCPICGNWYLPKQETKFNKSLADINKDNNKLQDQPKQESNVFDYLPELTKIKTQIADLKIKIEELSSKIEAIDRVIKTLEFQTITELQDSRNEISKFFAALEQGKNIQKQVNTMQEACSECNITNTYLNIVLETIKQYVKQKFKIIMKKLNQNLSSGIITLFKFQANGTLRENVTIIDKNSNASYSETNQSNKIKLGIEVCKLLQELNDINIPIFIDEVGRFNDYSFINSIGHQIIATLPTNDNQISIKK